VPASVAAAFAQPGIAYVAVTDIPPIKICDQLAAIDALDTGVRGGPEPDSITLDNFGMPIPEA